VFNRCELPGEWFGILLVLPIGPPTGLLAGALTDSGLIWARRFVHDMVTATKGRHLNAAADHARMCDDRRRLAERAECTCHDTLGSAARTQEAPSVSAPNLHEIRCISIQLAMFNW
jgi:hypothetical protein